MVLFSKSLDLLKQVKTMDKKIFLIDFDGTIILSDVAEHILRKFVKEDWLYFDKKFMNGELSLGETIVAQYSLIKTPKEVILQEVESVIKLRENFKIFVDFCISKDIEIKIVSGGIDFIIRHVLNKIGIPQSIEIVSVHTNYNSDGSLNVKLPQNFDPTIRDFKLDQVTYFKKEGYIVYYIGDASSDFEAVRGSDLTFSVINSKLSLFCIENNLKFIEFCDFKEILRFLFT
jgi:2,3-diketo-5-methylthio-1-phosphopentane phosphatase